LETPEAKLKSLLSTLQDPNGIYGSLRALEDWKAFYSTYSRKNGDMWNWNGTVLNRDNRAILAQAGEALSELEISHAGTSYPYVGIIGRAVPEAPALPFLESTPFEELPIEGKVLV
jgi:hypothetical protein